MALGGTPARVQFGVIGKTLLLTLTGIATGSIASLVVARDRRTAFRHHSHRPGHVRSSHGHARNGRALNRLPSGSKGLAH